MKLIYCYGVVEGSPELEKKGFESANVYVIPFKDISAIVSDVSEENLSQCIIDKNIRDMEWLAENALTHEDVVDYVMGKTTILPMKFCSIFKTKEKVESILREKYAELKYDLERLKGRIEMGVKIYSNAGSLKQRIMEESPDIKDLGEEARRKSPGAAYLANQKIDMLLKERIHQMLADDKKKIFDNIHAMAEEAKQNNLLDRKLTGRDMALNAVFLIRKSDLCRFRKGVNGMKPGYPHMEFEVSGPFPPYNFMD